MQTHLTHVSKRCKFWCNEAEKILDFVFQVQYALCGVDYADECDSLNDFL